MAENKKSFVLYADQITIVKKLVEKDRLNTTNYAGELFLHILEYVNDLNPEPLNFIVDMAFEPIKQQLKRDLIKYEVIKQKRSDAGKKSAESKKQSITNSTSVESVEQTSTNSTVSDNDIVIVNGTVTDINSKSHCDAIAPPEEVLEPIDSNSLKKSKPKRKKVAPKKEKETPHWKAICDQWFNFYKCHFVVSPTFNAVEGKHLKSILERFEKLAKAKDEGEQIEFNWSEDRALRTFEKFLLNAWSDKWLQEHFLLKNLSSNFDAIINKKHVDNGNTKQSPPGGKKIFKFNLEQAIAEQTGSCNP